MSNVRKATGTCRNILTLMARLSYNGAELVLRHIINCDVADLSLLPT